MQRELRKELGAGTLCYSIALGLRPGEKKHLAHNGLGG
jgi:hypothetical protein